MGHRLASRQVPQGQNKQSPYQIRQYFDKASQSSQSSHSVITESYEHERYPMNLGQLQAIAAAATEKADRDHPYSLPPGAPYTRDSAPDAPGPDKAYWVQNHYDYYKWNEELGYLKCTHCGVARQAHCFERADDEKAHNHELLPTCLECRNRIKKKNKSSSTRAKANGGRNQTQPSDEPKMMICWHPSTATGCGQSKNKECFATTPQYDGIARRSYCRECRDKPLFEMQPLDAAKRPRPRECQVEHHYYTRYSRCLECDTYVPIQNFDMEPFAHKAGLLIPKPICREHGGSSLPAENIVRICEACSRTWHIGQFINGKEGECYDCRIRGRKGPTEEEKKARTDERKMKNARKEERKMMMRMTMENGGGQQATLPENAREGY
ncbi:hypothetical protein F4775DRAFT_578557 [Biscogniauxia sp. FL1348]|nr:hypothetical protein F4775DRAFT_578557 [Biscogniauxia sp. FL1348]